MASYCLSMINAAPAILVAGGDRGDVGLSVPLLFTFVTQLLSSFVWLVTKLVPPLVADDLRITLPASRDVNELDESEILNHLSLRQVFNFPTHGPYTLDFIMTDLSEHYLPPQPLPPLDVVDIFLSCGPPPPHNTQMAQSEHTDSAARLFGY